jgi:hypothetical protein
MPKLYTTIRSALLVGFSSLSASCMPAILHGPQVDPGLVGGISMSFPSIDQRHFGGVGGDRFLAGPFGINLGHGWRSDQPGGAAVQVGVFVPGVVFVPVLAGVELTQADLYVQLPARVTGQLDAGVGVNLAPTHAMPYLQVGRISDEGSGWYTTQGISVMWDQTRYHTNDVAALAWLPTVAHQTGRPTRTVHLFVSGGFGQQFGGCFGGRCDADQFRWAVTTGVALQFHRKR